MNFSSKGFEQGIYLTAILPRIFPEHSVEMIVNSSV